MCEIKIIPQCNKKDDLIWNRSFISRIRTITKEAFFRSGILGSAFLVSKNMFRQTKTKRVRSYSVGRFEGLLLYNNSQTVDGTFVRNTEHCPLELTRAKLSRLHPGSIRREVIKLWVNEFSYAEIPILPQLSVAGDTP